MHQAPAVAGDGLDMSGACCGYLPRVNRSSGSNDNSGATLGLLRGIYWLGASQGGRTLRNGATDLNHIISTDYTNPDDAFMLRAVA